MTIRFQALPLGTKLYVSLIVAAGAATVLQSFYDLTVHPIGWDWAVLAVLTLVSGSATVRLPSLPATISVSETFVFTSVLLFGSAAGTLTVALDALVISFWSYRKGHPTYKIIFNVCALPLTIWIAAHIFFLFPSVQPLVTAPRSELIRIRDLLAPLLVFTVVYFSLNSWIITFAISLERRLQPFTIWRDNFLWLSLNYFGGASVAALLVSYTRDLDYTYLAVIIPLLVVLYFTFSMSMGRVEDANKHLRQLNTLYMSTVETLAMAIDAKDQITHGHIRRVQTYAVALAREAGVTDQGLIRAVEAAALLHDMGKLAVPEYILNKPGPLTPAEFDKMKLHASVGADILASIDFPYPVVPIVRHHHENWDGSGYPDGLAGTDIPIGARILSVVDCFDALTSDRPYRPRLSDKEALRILMERRGRMYDPLIVDTFAKVYDRIVPASPEDSENASLMAITDASQSSILPQSPAHRLDEIAASTEEMLTLLDLATDLTALVSLTEVGDSIWRHLRRLIPSSLCVFFLYEVESDELSAAYAAGDNASLIVGTRIGLGQRLSGWVAANRQSILNSDPVLDFGDAARAISPRPLSCLSTPLLNGTELIGVLTVYSTRKNAFSEEHQRVIEVIARQVAQIIRRAWESGRHSITAAHDHLAGLPTVEHLRQLAAGSSREHLQRPSSILLVGLENLDDIEQKQGRVGIDQVLFSVVSIIRRSLRTGDLLFRYGGSEFVALLPQTDQATAKAMAARIQSAAQLDTTWGTRLTLTVAASTLSEGDYSVDDLINRARDLMQRGRAGHLPRGSSPDSIH